MSRINKIAVGFFTVILVIFISLMIWVWTGTYEAGETAIAALQSNTRIQISNSDRIVFLPVEREKIGLVFYPGGLVEAEAYAPILRQLAEEGILVVITKMPLNLAILNPSAASSVIEDYPGIEAWILAGHSLGGASAAIFAKDNDNDIAALALWDSYPPESSDLSDSDLPVISIYGTTGQNPNTDSFDEKRGLLPVDTVFAAIEGANHAQFGDYGPQTGDVTAELSLAEQHNLVFQIMMDFINSLLRP